MRIFNAELKIIKADLTELSVDAIVNAANNELVMGGGVAGVIRKKGGHIIEEEAVKKGPIKIGESVATAAGTLKAQYVIHAATMGMDFKTDEHKIRAATFSALTCADQLKIKSVAFPALGCGVGKFSLVGAAKIMAQEAWKFLRHHKETTIKEIIFCLYHDKDYDIFDKTISGYMRHLQEDLGLDPFVCVDIIIELKQGIVIIERSNPPYGWALPGGFLDWGESLEDAAKREAKEETHLELKNLRQFHTYSQMGRDPRFQTISTIFIAEGVGTPKSGDDAQDLKVIPYEELLNHRYAFDHHQVLADYLRARKSGGYYVS